MPKEPNPSGLCMCGCGQPTKIASFNRAGRGWMAGKPIRYIKGHENSSYGPDYVIDPTSGCWVWQKGRTSAGYGLTYEGGGREHPKRVLAHRRYYERLVGPIPEGFHLDHTCRNRACVNPAHLEAVTQGENNRRMRSTKLTVQQVTEIRKAIARGARQSDLARKFGVSPECIAAVKQRRSWKNVV